MATDSPLLPLPFITFAHVLAHLPEIPPVRIRLDPRPGTATEADIFRVRRQEGKLCEIFDGVLVEKAMGQLESVLAIYVAVALSNYLDEQGIEARVSGADSLLRLWDEQVRMPDVALILRSQFPSGKFPTDRVWNAYPDLAVEVRSESNTAKEITRKIGEYFAAGSRLVWVIDPPSRTVTAYTSAIDSSVHGIDDTLDGGDILPGFTLAVSRIFRE